MLCAVGKMCLLRVIGGHFSFLRIKIQYIDLDSFVFTFHFISYTTFQRVNGDLGYVIDAISASKYRVESSWFWVYSFLRSLKRFLIQIVWFLFEDSLDKITMWYEIWFGKIGVTFRLVFWLHPNFLSRLQTSLLEFLRCYYFISFFLSVLVKDYQEVICYLNVSVNIFLVKIITYFVSSRDVLFPVASWHVFFWQ